MRATEQRPSTRSPTNSQPSLACQGSRSSKKRFSFYSSYLRLNFSRLNAGGWIFLSIFSPKLVVELGMGDGTLLETLAKCDRHSTYIGIELNNEQCVQARSRITLSNVIIMNSSFEDIVPTFLDESIDQFIAVLPDPALIDEKSEERWKPFYRSRNPCQVRSPFDIYWNRA